MRDEEILRKLEKWQEPPPAKQPKPLPAPDAEVKKRRGGKRLRKTKERYGLTDVSTLSPSALKSWIACALYLGSGVLVKSLSVYG